MSNNFEDPDEDEMINVEDDQAGAIDEDSEILDDD